MKLKNLKSSNIFSLFLFIILNIISVNMFAVNSGQKPKQVIKQKHIIPTNNNNVIKKNTLELSYDIAAQNLINEIDTYIKYTAPSSNISATNLLENCLKYDIDICFVLAQGHIESNFGTKGAARRTNSVWNVITKRGNNKKMYKTPNDSVEPYMQLLRSKYLLNGKTEYDLLKHFVDKHGKRYASSRKYENQLRKKVKEINSKTNIGVLYKSLKEFYSIIWGF